jgi:hypothetical protein
MYCNRSSSSFKLKFLMIFNTLLLRSCHCLFLFDSVSPDKALFTFNSLIFRSFCKALMKTQIFGFSALSCDLKLLCQLSVTLFVIGKSSFKRL